MINRFIFPVNKVQLPSNNPEFTCDQRTVEGLRAV